MRGNLSVLAVFLPALLAAAVSAQEPSSAPLTLNISKDAYKSRVGLDYAVRWDFSDLASFRPRLDTLARGVKALASWDITENTRVDYYGFRTNPWRLIITKQKKAAPAAAEGGASSAVLTRSEPEYHKRVRLSLSPLVDDLKRNFDEGLRDYLLRSSLRRVSPEWEKAGDTGRKAFVKDVLSLGLWDAQVAPVQDAREGLEYISGGGRKKGSAAKRWEVPDNIK